MIWKSLPIVRKAFRTIQKSSGVRREASRMSREGSGTVRMVLRMTLRQSPGIRCAAGAAVYDIHIDGGRGMPSSRGDMEKRRLGIVKILKGGEPVGQQKEIVEMLREMGISDRIG